MSTKIYSWTGNPRGDICRIAADLAGVNAEFVNTPYAELKSKEFLAKHPLGKVPFLETPEGNLFETHAILKYFGRKANALGENAFEEA
jgi:elongation factor 1-gamma